MSKNYQTNNLSIVIWFLRFYLPLEFVIWDFYNMLILMHFIKTIKVFIKKYTKNSLKKVPLTGIEPVFPP